MVLCVLLLACGSTKNGDSTATNSNADTGPMVTTDQAMNIMPEGSKPNWAPDIDPQMQAVIEQLTAAEPPKYPQSSPFQVRNAVLPTEAVAELLMKTGMPPMPPKTDVVHKVLPVGPEEGILVRMYKPLNAGNGPLPLIVYYHGGGWVIADLDTYEPSARALAAQTGAIVASVAYRQAPEHTFPTAHEDSYAAYKWFTENAGQVGGDPDRIATAGESAGGNLALAVAMMARDRGAKMPAHILSVYPIADGDVQSPSYDQYAKAKPLNRPFMEWFFNYYSPDWKSNTEPLISLVDADLSQLPPVTIVNARIDPLLSDGEMLADKLKSAGVKVERKVYEGVTHEFFGMAALLEQAVQAQEFAAMRLKNDLGVGGNMKQGSKSGSAVRGMTVSGGLRGPESAIYDPAMDVYYVTNVNGKPGAMDDNGFISKVNPDGSIRELKWIDGADRNVNLSAPKGTALHNGMLYVADLDGVHVFDTRTGGQAGFWPTPDAQFLNAVAVDARGNVYATDTGIEFTDNGPVPKGNSKIYKWDPNGNRSILKQGDEIRGVNGIVALPDGSVASASLLSDKVYKVSPTGMVSTLATIPGKTLDGLVALPDGTHLVTSWGSKTVYHLMADGSTRVVVEGLGSPADIHVDTKRMYILVPQLMENRLQIVPLGG